MRQFQFTPLREGRQLGIATENIEALFQFTPLREGRPNEQSTQEYLTLFQFTPLREGRLFLACWWPPGLDISIHAPPRGATDTPPEQLEVHRQFQFTPLREGRHDDGTRVLKSYLFHIHAPPRGATVGCAQGVEQIHISIHAPPRGATGTRRICGTRSANFNSRPSARGDLRISAHTVSRKISIHAPPRGATVKDSGFKKHLYFNSRPSARGDQAWRSTFRRTYNFNSRPSARGDHCGINTLLIPFISIHAPPRGATGLI